MAELADYRDRFAPRFSFERSDTGVLTVRWHQPMAGRDDPAHMDVLGFPPLLQLAEEVWTAIASDLENRAVILTGAEGTFYGTNESHPVGPNTFTADRWSRVMRGVARSLDAFVDLPTILIGAACGPAMVHSEYLLACDLLLATPDATFGSRAHYARDMPPGDGSNVIFPLLLGWRRAADLMLTGGVITADEALDLGIVREIVPADELLARSRELAEELAAPGNATRRFTAVSLRQRLRRMLNEEVHHTMALEGLIYLDRNLP